MQKSTNLFFRSLLCGGMLFAAAAGLGAEEKVDRFILPETPPTIERLKKPPLDEPVLRKQNFVSDSDISLPPVLLGLNVYRFYSDEYPVSVGLYHGSFGSLGGHLAFSSPRGFRLGYAADGTSGESPRLAREKNAFEYEAERSVSDSLKVGGAVQTLESKFWTQRKDLVSLRSNAVWYAAGNLNVTLDAAYARAGIKGMDANESWSGTAAVAWQPRDGHDVLVSYAPERDTAFGAGNDFSTLGLEYGLTLGSRFAVSGGYRLQDGTSFPLGRFVWNVMPRLRFNAAYEPGIERVSWYDLYLAKDAFVRSVPGLAFPKSTFRMREGISYYWDEKGSASVEFSQASVENYLYWQKDAGSDHLAPATLPGEYVSSCRLDLAYTWEGFTPRAGVSWRSDNDRPLVPEYVASMGLGWSGSGWTAEAGYDLVSSRCMALGDNRTLDAYGDLSLSVSRTIAGGIDIFAAASNLLGQKIETQPGFAATALNFKAGLTAKF